jgi:hypothetical protein
MFRIIYRMYNLKRNPIYNNIWKLTDDINVTKRMRCYFSLSILSYTTTSKQILIVSNAFPKPFCCSVRRCKVCVSQCCQQSVQQCLSVITPGFVGTEYFFEKFLQKEVEGCEVSRSGRPEASRSKAAVFRAWAVAPSCWNRQSLSRLCESKITGSSDSDKIPHYLWENNGHTVRVWGTAYHMPICNEARGVFCTTCGFYALHSRLL